MKPIDHYIIEGAINIGLQPQEFYKENIMKICYLINEEVEDTELFQSTEVLDKAYSIVTTKDKQGRAGQPREGPDQVQHYL